MIIQSIRLHPFAGIADKTYSFEKGLTVICGPNEEGKSTVAKAIRQVLFLETNLTPARKQNMLLDVLPVIGGDTIRITMEFVYNNVDYTLTKQWGPISNVELKSSAGVILTNCNAVQERVSEMLPANQAVVEQVLIASQSQLADAVDKLSGTVQTSLSDQLRAAILKGGGISATQLEETINSNTDSYFGRWDESTGSVHGGASRGLTNPWRNGVGRIASAWYGWQEAIEQERVIDTYETENNRLQAELNKCNEELKSVRIFLREHKPAYDAVNKRIGIEGEIMKFQTALEGFAKDAQRWPIALAEQVTANDALFRANQEGEELSKELAQARQKADMQKDQDNLIRVNELKRKVDEAEHAVKDVVEIPEADVAMTRKHQQEVARCQTLIDGQKLLFRINPAASGSIEVSHSGGQSETIIFSSGQQLVKQVSGSVAFDWQGVSFTIQSANEDVTKLGAALQKAATDLQVLLKKYEQPSVESLETTAEQYRNGLRQIQQAKSNLQAALGSDSFESLNSRCEEAAALPGTRDIKVLEELTKGTNNIAGRHQANLTNLQKEIEDLEKKHSSLHNLDERRLNGMQAIKEKEKELGMLPTVPEGYESAIAFQKEYSDVLEKEKVQSEYKHALELKKQALLEPELSSADAKEQTILAKNKFETALAEGKAYRRVQEALQAILASADANAFQPLHQKTEAYLQLLSAGRFSRIPFEVTQPQQLVGDNVSLPVSLLSKGTKDILALSLRLAAAEVYLANNTGFVMMDDPLVDMDRRRRESSAAVLKDFAKTHQTIVFTCHEAHANLLQIEKVGHAGRETELS